MTRRQGIGLSAVSAALLASCSSKNKDPREKLRAHSTAMFLLILQPNYLQQSYSDTPQDQLPGKSLLRKVVPEVFEKMRANIRTQIALSNEAAVIKQYSDAHNLMYAVTTSPKAPVITPGAKPADQAYTSPDECPCLVDDSCPSVESLLAF